MEHETNADTMHALDRARREFVAELATMPATDVPAAVENAPFLSAADVQRYTEMANRRVDERLGQLAEQREARAISVREQMDRVLGDVEQVTEELRSFPDSVRAGRITFRDAQKQMAELADMRRRLAEHLEAHERSAERITAEEDDPIAAMKTFERKYPHLRTTVGGYLLRLGEHDPQRGVGFQRSND